MVGKIKQLTFSDGTAVTPPSLGTIVTDASAVTYLDFTEGSAPAAPSAGAVRVYSKAGDVLAYKTPGGTEVQVLTSTGISTAVPEVDASDATKQLVTSLSAAVTGKKTTLSFAQTVDRVVSFPDATDTLVGRATADILSNKTFSDALTLTEIATPTSPSAGSVKMYAKSGDAVYILNSAGTETQVGSGSGQKNYAQVSSNTNAGWTGFGTVAVTTDVVPADLPRPNTTQTGWKLTPSGVSGTFTVTIATPAVFTATAHGMRTGFIATLSNSGGALPTGLTAGTPYFVTVVDANTFKVSTTYANLLAGTFVATSGSQSGTQSFAFGGGRIRFTLDPADYNVKQQLQHAQNILSGATGDWSVDVWSNTASNYSGTYTRLPLSTDSSGTSLLPNLEGTYRTTFDAPGSAAQYIEVTYQRASANTHALVGSDLISGPGVAVQGAAVSAWQSVTMTSTITTNATITALERRVGTMAQYDVTIAFSGANSQGDVAVNLPSGRTIDTTSFGGTTPPSYTKPLGWASYEDASGSSYYDGTVTYKTTTSVSVEAINASGTYAAGNVMNTSTPIPVAPAVGDNIRLKFEVPIAEWAGSGTVNIASNDNDWYYTSGTWDADDSTSVQGQLGGAISGTLASTRTKTITLSRPLQQGDEPIVEVQVAGVGPWLPLLGQADVAVTNYGTAPLAYAGAVGGTTSYGVLVAATDAVTVKVLFGRYKAAAYNGTSWVTVAWDTGGISSGSKWRLKIRRGGQATGFGTVAPGVSSGLVSASGVPGFTDGSTGTSGYVGETFEASGAQGTTAGTYAQASSAINLTAGDWDVYATFNSRGAASLTQTEFCVGTTSASNTGTVAAKSKVNVAIPSTLNSPSSGSISFRLSLSATTPYFVNVKSTGANDTVDWYFYARRRR